MRIVVATADVLGAKMAGPAIRAHHLAHRLASERASGPAADPAGPAGTAGTPAYSHQVELVTTAECTLEPQGGLSIRAIAAAGIADLTARTDVWIVQGAVMLRYPEIAASDAVVVVDLYDPYHLEGLEHSRAAPLRDRLALVHNAAVALNTSMCRADFFLASSEKQRDFWLGALASLGRINPLTYDADPTLAALFAIVPFGLDETPPTHREPVLRGVVPGIGENDSVLIWGGGLYNWFDPQTLVRAVDALKARRDDVRLVFLGTGHPNPSAPTMRTATATRKLSDDLGLTGRHVFFNEGWVPYDQRGSYLLEADIGVSTHLDHVETAFSFRTRILDYLWAGLPIVATDGDAFAPVIAERGLGRVVPPGDAAALAAALLELLDDADLRASCAQASKRTAREYTWARATQPLVDFCAAPRRAPDLANPIVRRHLARPLETVRAPTPGPPGWRGEIALAKQYLADGGISLLARRLATRAAKLARGRTD